MQRREEMNITLSVDDEIVKKVRKIAIDKNTTLTAMVRGYLTSVANGDIASREELIQKLKSTFHAYSRNMGPRTWKREDLYDR